MRKPEAKINRVAPRQPIELDVTLMVSGQPPFSGKTRDASLGGVFIETNISRLPGKTDVYLALALPIAGNTQHHRVRARIVRQTENGAGMVFADPGIDVIHALRKVIYRPPVVARTHAPGILAPAGGAR